MINPNIFVYLVMSIIIIWKSAIAMIEKKRVGLFLPFYIVGILFCFNSAFLFYELQPKYFFAASKFLFSLILVWILIIIRRENGS